MKTLNLGLFLLAVGPAAKCATGPTAAFYPAAPTTLPALAAKPSPDGIEILANLPSTPVTVLGELRIQAQPDASLRDLMLVALREAMNQGADFIALGGPTGQPPFALGKMVPVGHGRSQFVAGKVQGNEVNRIAANPAQSLTSLRVILGHYADAGLSR